MPHEECREAEDNSSDSQDGESGIKASESYDDEEEPV